MLQTSGEGALLTSVLLLIMEKVASLTNKTMWSLLSAENEGLLAHSGVNISRAVIEQFAVSLSKQIVRAHLSGESRVLSRFYPNKKLHGDRNSAAVVNRNDHTAHEVFKQGYSPKSGIVIAG